jgi:hypothetical protein
MRGSTTCTEAGSGSRYTIQVLRARSERNAQWEESEGGRNAQLLT